MKENPADLNQLMSLVVAMPAGQLVLFGLFMATWLIGGNIVIAMHYKRMGKHWASGFRPLAFPFKDFNKKEWLALLLLALVSMSFAVAGLAYGD